METKEKKTKDILKSFLHFCQLPNHGNVNDAAVHRIVTYITINITVTQGKF